MKILVLDLDQKLKKSFLNVIYLSSKVFCHRFRIKKANVVFKKIIISLAIIVILRSYIYLKKNISIKIY